MLLSQLTTVLPTPGSAIFTLLLSYVLFEIGFFFHYHWVLIPRANRINVSKPPAPYRDYPEVQDRIKLLNRIIERLAKRVPADNDITTKPNLYYKFIESWFVKKLQDVPYEQFSKQFDMATLDVAFCPAPPPMLRMAWSFAENRDGLNESSSESSLNETGDGNERTGNCRGSNVENPYQIDSKQKLKKDNMDEFLSWAFFGVHYSIAQSKPEMLNELDKIYKTLEEIGLTFEPGRNRVFSPRCFTYENVNSVYRPYCVYVSVAFMRAMANLTLTIMGFQKYTCKRGLEYWYRAAKSSNNKESPFLFFHGIAPGGHTPYLPMIFCGLLRGSSWNRDVFLFENKPVSYSFLCFDALSEDETVNGVVEAIEYHLGGQCERNLTFCGHSLGSCQIALMVKSPQLRKRMQNLILLDPVSILLSEPDVMINFLYTRRQCEDVDKTHYSWIRRMIRFCHESKIHLVASSELFIEHYLRRNFAWYNCELWLADIPKECNVLVCLSEYDEIVNSRKVEREVIEHNNVMLRNTPNGHRSLVEIIMWKGVGHANCITHSDKWMDIHKAMEKMK
jgi:hypothetical protein